MLFCGRQCIALRGDNEDIIAGEGNPGNLLALLKLLAVHDDALRAHLDSPAIRNATYLSHRTQNEIIEVLGQHIILKVIIEEIKQAQFYAILADEVTSHNQEYLVPCVRFVAEDKAVREEFLGFLKLERITGEEIAGTIVKFLRDHGITLEGMRGQGYDGAANMSSDRVGVQKRIRDLAPHATYIHCHSHSLNLVITHTCSLPDIRNIVDKLQHCCHFFLNSPKRSGALEVVVTANVDDSQRKSLSLTYVKHVGQSATMLTSIFTRHIHSLYKPWSSLGMAVMLTSTVISTASGIPEIRAKHSKSLLPSLHQPSSLDSCVYTITCHTCPASPSSSSGEA